MKEKKNFGYLSQGYVAPRAENVAIENECLIMASSQVTTPSISSYNVEDFGRKSSDWGN